MYERHRDNLDDFAKTVRPLDHQVGVAFVIGDRIVGLEMFDRPNVLANFLPKVVRGYALDAMDVRTRQPHRQKQRSDVLRFIERLGENEEDVYPALGMGEDVRLGEDGAVGAALVVGSVPVHFCAFASQKPRR